MRTYFCIMFIVYGTDIRKTKVRMTCSGNLWIAMNKWKQPGMIILVPCSFSPCADRFSATCNPDDGSVNLLGNLWSMSRLSARLTQPMWSAHASHLGGLVLLQGLAPYCPAASKQSLLEEEGPAGAGTLSADRM